MSKPGKLVTIRIADLHLRAIIGIFDWEREKKQDILINVELEYDALQAINSDDINSALDYKALTKSIISKVEGSTFQLLEKLADFVLEIVMQEQKVEKAAVRIDKPQALRYARSVSIERKASKNHE